MQILILHISIKSNNKIITDLIFVRIKLFLSILFSKITICETQATLSHICNKVNTKLKQNWNHIQDINIFS